MADFNFLSLFNVIEDVTDVPDQVKLSPDKAIDEAKLALTGKGDLSAALTQLEDQIGKFRQVVRGLTFDVMELLASEKGVRQGKLNRLGTELHNLAAMICLRLDRVPDARHHLASALACNLNDQDTQFLYVEVYEKTAAFTEAFEQLDRTFGNVTITDRFYRLFELCWNTQQIDPAKAYPLYKKLSGLPGAGLLGDLAKLQLSSIDNKAAALSAEMARAMLNQGKQQRDDGKTLEALASFFQVLGSYPFHPGAWYFIGDLYLSFFAPPEEREYIHVRIKENEELDEHQKTLLNSAVQALQITIAIKPDESYVYMLLISCFITLRDYENAIGYASTLYRQEPNDIRIKGLYSLTLALDGHSAEAENLAREVLQQNSAEINAVMTMERLHRLTPKN